MTPQQRAAFKKLIERHKRVNTSSKEAALASLLREELRERGKGKL